MDGWVKLWRKSLESGLLQNHQLWAFWCWCLMKASHKTKKQMIGYQMVELKPGQFVFGRKQAANELGMSEQQVRTCLKKLKKLQNLTTKPTNKFTIISIVNWETYQQEQARNQPTEQPAANQQLTSSSPAANHKQECKNAKNEKNIPSTFLDVSQKFLEYQQEQLGEKLVKVTDKKVRDGAETLEKLTRLDGYDLDADIRPALNWAIHDDFWSKQVRSLCSLRRPGNNGEMKFTNLLSQYYKNNNKPQNTPSAYY
mgnify:CR=1 FL=1